MMSPIMKFVCPYCKEFSTENNGIIYKHMETCDKKPPEKYKMKVTLDYDFGDWTILVTKDVLPKDYEDKEDIELNECTLSGDMYIPNDSTESGIRIAAETLKNAILKIIEKQLEYKKKEYKYLSELDITTAKYIVR